MTNYEQPDFYRFNEDSLKLVSFVMASKFAFGSILDLGAGCGVIGIELAQKAGVTDLTLLEIQNDFIPHLEKNSESISKVKVVHSSFGAWAPQRAYDCIVSNPPYYQPNRGEKSLDPRRNIARSFTQDDWKILLRLIDLCLSSEGKAFIVLRHDRLTFDQVRLGKPSSLQLKEHVEGKLIFLELSRLNVN